MTLPGVFVAVVGPSGAGKDTLLRGARAALGANPAFVFARRVITRATDGNEDSIGVEPAAFNRMKENGAFLHWWEAHGLSYGLPASLDDAIAAGKIVVANVSRAVIPEIRASHERARVVEITASPAVLAARLQARGRETGEAQAARLARSEALSCQWVPDFTILNDDAPESAAARLVAYLESLLPGEPAPAEG